MKRPFFRASPLFREISGVLLFKFAVILLAGFTIFGAAHRVHVDSVKMSAQILPPH
jgi:hypothetical protein